MTNIDHLLDRNRVFADTDARRDVPALPFLPRQGLYILGPEPLAFVVTAGLPGQIARRCR